MCRCVVFSVVQDRSWTCRDFVVLSLVGTVVDGIVMSVAVVVLSSDVIDVVVALIGVVCVQGAFVIATLVDV